MNGIFKLCTFLHLSTLFHNRIKDKINHPPEKQDFQKVSYTLANFIRLKDDAKSASATGKPRKRRAAHGDHQTHDADEDRPENYANKGKGTANTKRKANDTATAKSATSVRGGNAFPEHRHDKQLPEIRRLQNEPDLDYLRRVNRITQASIKESQFEAKYGVEVVRNQQTGEIKIKKRPADEFDEQIKARKLAKRRGEIDDDGNPTKKKQTTEIRMTKAEQLQRAKELIAAKREAKREALAARPVEYKTDVVAFGEVTHGPPTLVTPRRAQKAETVARVNYLLAFLKHMETTFKINFSIKLSQQPGAKSSLLLHSVIDPTIVPEVSAKKPFVPNGGKVKMTAHGTIDLTGKRKELPTATRMMIEKQQQNVMDMYRQLKKKNRMDGLTADA